MNHTCPKRMSGLGPWERESDLDTWLADATCSFCGSLSPDVLMDRLYLGDVSLTPTDKSYKVYVRNEGGVEKQFFQSYRDCPPEIRCGGPKECRHWVTRPTSECKFYFEHFSQEQCRKFIDLLNGGRLRVNYPGYFYTVPFFAKRA